MAVALVVVSAFACLATSRECEGTVERTGSASLAMNSAAVSRRYHVTAPLRSELSVHATVASDGGATVRIALVPDDPSLWASEAGPIQPPETVVVVEPGTSSPIDAWLPECSWPGCDDYAVALEIELVEGVATDVSWATRVTIDECEAEREDKEYYVELREE